MSDFVHLHLHTEFSLLDGACRIEELLDEAAKLKMPALAVTEHGNMFSAVVFHDAARKRGIKPILGCEVYVAPGSRLDKSGTIGENCESPGPAGGDQRRLSESHQAGVRGLHRGLLLQAADRQAAPRRPQQGPHRPQQLSERRGRQRNSWRAGQARPRRRGDLPRHPRRRQLLPGNAVPGPRRTENRHTGLLPIARDLGMPLVATNDVHYLRQDDHKPHDILLCIGTGKSVHDAQRLRYHGDQFFLKTAAEMAEIFKDHPEAIRNTARIAERVNVEIAGGQYHLPKFDVPEGFELDQYFEHVTRAGFSERLARLRQLADEGKLRHPISDYEQRLVYEIEMIRQMGYAGYFLIVWDFIRYAREQGIPVGPGRGSSAGSLVAWAMRITDVDPLHYGLIFERFLNPERVSLPDIDVDFCERRRGEVIEYVTRRYGRANVSQIITFGTMKAKAVVRDVGRAMDLPYADVDRIAKQIPPALDMTLGKALAENPALRQMQEQDPRVKDLLDMGKRLEGMSRNAGVHAAGVVIAPGPITDYAPLFRSNRDEITTQWAMKEVERVGLLKMDFLGLSTLTLIRDALGEIKRTEGIDLDIDAVSLDDPGTYQLFVDGQTYGIFQFESSGMREILRKAKPQRLDDLIALNALYRPGPLKSGMVDDFIARKAGKSEFKYELAELEPILAETYGVIAYQEQVMRIARDVAGFSLGRGPTCCARRWARRTRKSCRRSARASWRAPSSAVSAEKKATKLFELVEHFAGYGFPKAHSTTYALLAYQTAYLKANYPRHFAAALLTIEAANTDKLALYISECRDRGIAILPPDINESDLQFTVCRAACASG